ncbi:MAG TPA: DMT family transporter, partial [Chitinophagales bacterium]|nr:DMT family transporter [Chitinophagales bacterium]HNM30753.1 DMT family transporter [Chitinophagales bacterium]
MKYGLKTFTWDQVAALRISFSFVFTLPLFIYHFNKIKRAEIKYYCAVGFFGSGLPAFCFTFAQTHIASGITGVLNSLTPVFTFVIGVLLFGMRFERMKFYGLLIALTGAILLVVFDKTEGGESNLLYALPLFLATMSYAMSANIVKKYLQTAHPLALGAVGFMFIGIPAMSYLFSTDFVDRASMETFAISFSSVMALSFFGTVLASLGYYMLIQKTDPIFGSLVAYLIPIVAIIAGAADGETLKAYHLAGMAFILLGIWVINRRSASKATA